MIHRATLADELSARRPARIGWVLVFMLVIIVLLGILVINSFFVTAVRVQQESATDAAALAAAEVLADEALLYGDPSNFDLSHFRSRDREGNGRERDDERRSAARPSLFCRAAEAGCAFGRKNLVGGKSFDVRTADVFFDIVDVCQRNIHGTMHAEANSELGMPLTLAQKRRINSVQVVGKSVEERENALRLPFCAFFSKKMITRADAVLDGHIHGFHTDPCGSINIPLAPIALCDAKWREQVEKWVDPTFATPSDGPLPWGDCKVTIGADHHDPESRKPGAYAPILLIGASSIGEAVTQCSPGNPGITPAHYGKYLAACGQKTLALDLNTLQLPVPGSPHINAGDLAQLEQHLRNLPGKRLIWPLYSGYEKNGPASNVIICGFVAARVTEVNRVTYSIVTDKRGHAVPNGKHRGTSAENPRWKKHQRDDQGNGDDSGNKDRPNPDGRRTDDDNGDGGDNRPGDGSNNHKKHGHGESCIEFTALQLTLRPTLLATSTGIVCVKDWPTGPQHQFRFPNAYVKRIRLLK
jgi:hypothetical protein